MKNDKYQYLDKMNNFRKNIKKNYFYFYQAIFEAEKNIYFDNAQNAHWFFFDGLEFKIDYKSNYYLIIFNKEPFEYIEGRKEFFQYIKKYNEKLKTKHELDKLLIAKTGSKKGGLKI